jgi:D-lactate dehydrogenase
MRVAVFSTKPYDRTFLEAANRSHDHALTFLEPRLTSATARLAEGHDAACLFVNDVASAEVLQQLAAGGTRMLALRSAGFNHVDLAAAARHGFAVARVPAYSPHAVAEHTVGLMLALNRHVHRAYNRVREGNFALDGLLGFDMRGKTVGVVGTGKIGAIVAQIVHGFGCDILAYDLAEHPGCVALGARYVPLDVLLARSDIITLHCPLTPQTYHLIDGAALARMRPGAMLVNTSRGALLDAQAAIEALKSGQLGYLGLDVYEEEADLFFEDLSNRVLRDDVFARLLTFPNVIITGHQAFFTQTALTAIAETTMANLTAFATGQALANRVPLP